MDVLLVEDELPALDRLEAAVRQWDPAVRIVGRLQTVKEALAWFRSRRPPDLALMDVQLADGLSLEVFEALDVVCPVVMVTAYDDYVLDALGHNCIDYVLKPIRQERLAQALDKYLRLRNHFAGDLRGLATSLGRSRGGRLRLLVRKGLDMVSLPVDRVAYVYTEYKLVFVRDTSGTQYLYDRSIGDLEADLAPERFLRLNRKYLAHIEAVRSVRAAGKGRLLVVLDPPTAEPVVVSQERAGLVRQWLEGR